MRTVADLTKDDKMKIKFEKRFSYVLILLIISVGLFFNLAYFLAFKDKLGLTGLIIIDLGIGLITVLLYYYMNKKLHKDLKSNSKVITLVKVDQKMKIKSEEAGSGVWFIPILGNLFPKLWSVNMKEVDVYYLVINGFRYEVEKEFFDTIKEGDEIERHTAKYSKILLNFSKQEFFN